MLVSKRFEIWDEACLEHGEPRLSGVVFDWKVFWSVADVVRALLTGGPYELVERRVDINRHLAVFQSCSVIPSSNGLCLYAIHVRGTEGEIADLLARFKAPED